VFDIQTDFACSPFTTSETLVENSSNVLRYYTNRNTNTRAVKMVFVRFERHTTNLGAAPQRAAPSSPPPRRLRD